MGKIYPLIYLSIMLLFFSCGKDDSPSITAITLSDISLIMKEGEEKTITVTHTPSDLQEPLYTWHSSNKEIVEVANGHIKAIQEGNAIITCEVPDLNISASCSIKVEQILPESVSLSAEKNSIYVGEFVTLIANVLPETTKDKSISWKSSDTKIATIDKEGNVQGIAPGNVIITAQTNKGRIEASYELEVLKIKVESVSLNKNTLSLLKGRTEALEVLILPLDATYKQVKWTSENEDIAVVSQKGVVTAKKQGVTKIVATSTDENISASCEISVINNNNVKYNPYEEDRKW